MAVLRAALACSLLAACYSPEVRDCTVSCASPDDCAAGQMCGADGMCASPERAGHCFAQPEIVDDAGVADGDARDGAVDAPVMVDAAVDARPDAPPPTVDLHVKISGRGRVVAPGIACDSEPPDHGDCHFTVLAGATLTLFAWPHVGQSFDKWQGGPCAGQDASCTFTPSSSVTAAVKFEKKHDEAR